MKKNRNVIIFTALYLAYTSIYFARLNLSMASPGMIEAGIADTVQIGLLGSIFSVIYSVGRLLNGTMSDSQPPFKMICTGLATAGLSNFFVGFFPPFIGIMLLWGTNAYAQSMLWSSVLCCVSHMYDEVKAKKMVSYMVTSVATGNIAGIIVNTFIILKFGLKFAFIVPGAITLLLSIPLFFCIKHIPKPEPNGKKHISIFKLLGSGEISAMLIPAMLHGVIKDNISLWMTVYFVDVFGINLNESSYFVLFIPVMGFIGRIIYPALLKLSRDREHVVSVYSFAACIVLSCPLFLISGVPVLSAVCLALIYAFISVINTSILSIYPIRFAKTGNVASVSGIMDFATYLGAGIGSFAYGILIKSFGYSPMFVSWAVVCVVSAVVVGLIEKKRHGF